MKSEYFASNPNTTQLLECIKRKYFPELDHIKVGLILFDGPALDETYPPYTIGALVSTKNVDQTLIKKVNLSDYAFLIFINREPFILMPLDLQIRLIRHELRHCRPDKEVNYHDYDISSIFGDFKKEVELNVDRPNWRLEMYKWWFIVYPNLVENKEFIGHGSTYHGISRNKFIVGYSNFKEQIEKLINTDKVLGNYDFQ